MKELENIIRNARSNAENNAALMNNLEKLINDWPTENLKAKLTNIINSEDKAEIKIGLLENLCVARNTLGDILDHELIRKVAEEWKMQTAQEIQEMEHWPILESLGDLFGGLPVEALENTMKDVKTRGVSYLKEIMTDFLKMGYRELEKNLQTLSENSDKAQKAVNALNDTGCYTGRVTHLRGSLKNVVAKTLRDQVQNTIAAKEEISNTYGIKELDVDILTAIKTYLVQGQGQMPESLEGFKSYVQNELKDAHLKNESFKIDGTDHKITGEAWVFFANTIHTEYATKTEEEAPRPIITGKANTMFMQFKWLEDDTSFLISKMQGAKRIKDLKFKEVSTGHVYTVDSESDTTLNRTLTLSLVDD